MYFKDLHQQVRQTHHLLQKRVASLLSQHLVFRNWLIGYHLALFENTDAGEAPSATSLADRLSEAFAAEGIRGLSSENLALYRRFYHAYPHLESVAGKFLPFRILIPETDETPDEWKVPAELLINKLTFAHFEALLQVEDPGRRFFYETACLKGNWSARQLRHEMAGQQYERTGPSLNKAALLAQISKSNSLPDLAALMRERHVFEFAGLNPQKKRSEIQLKRALLDRVQTFLLNMGAGFGMEAREKSFVIGERVCTVDLLFYHRHLKCHVAVVLKTQPFKPEDAAHLNLYLQHHQENGLADGDIAPIGLALYCRGNEAMARYTTGMPGKQVFAEHYRAQLPEEGMLRDFLLGARKKLAEDE